MTMTGPSRGVAGRRRRPEFGPPAMFVAAVVVAFVPLGLSCLTLPQFSLPLDLAMPLASLVLFALAGATALVAWRRGPVPASDSVTYLDVAGALTFIGIFAASQVDPDQMVRIVAAYRED